MTPAFSDEPSQSHESTDPWILRLYVAGDTFACVAAIRNARRIVKEFLPAGSLIEVLDLSRDGDIAEAEQILAIPTLIRRQPTPLRRIIGDLHDTDRVLVSLGVEGYTGLD